MSYLGRSWDFLLIFGARTPNAVFFSFVLLVFAAMATIASYSAMRDDLRTVPSYTIVAGPGLPEIPKIIVENGRPSEPGREDVAIRLDLEPDGRIGATVRVLPHSGKKIRDPFLRIVREAEDETRRAFATSIAYHAAEATRETWRDAALAEAGAPEWQRRAVVFRTEKDDAVANAAGGSGGTSDRVGEVEPPAGRSGTVAAVLSGADPGRGADMPARLRIVLLGLVAGNAMALGVQVMRSAGHLEALLATAIGMHHVVGGVAMMLAASVAGSILVVAAVVPLFFDTDVALGIVATTGVGIVSVALVAALSFPFSLHVQLRVRGFFRKSFASLAKTLALGLVVAGPVLLLGSGAMDGTAAAVLPWLPFVGIVAASVATPVPPASVVVSGLLAAGVVFMVLRRAARKFDRSDMLPFD